MFEKMQRTGRQYLEMKVFGTEKIVFEKAEYSIFDTGIREYPNSDVEVWVLNFRDKRLAERIDAALIYIKPGKSTPIQSWLGERIFIETVVQGSTTWIGVAPGGDLLSYEFSHQYLTPPAVRPWEEVNPVSVGVEPNLVEYGVWS